MVRDVGSRLKASHLCNCDFILSISLQANSVNVVRSAGSCVGLVKPYKPLRRSPCCIVLAVIVASLSRPSKDQDTHMLRIECVHLMPCPSRVCVRVCLYVCKYLSVCMCVCVCVSDIVSTQNVCIRRCVGRIDAQRARSRFQSAHVSNVMFA